MMKFNAMSSVLAAAAILAACGGTAAPEEVFITPAQTELECTSEAQSLSVRIDASGTFEAYTNDEWITDITPHFSDTKSETVSFKVAENLSVSSRTGGLLIRTGTTIARVDVKQAGHEVDENAIKCPLDGYDLVWNDEFTSTDLSKNWIFEDWAPGQVNNELQRYVAGGSLDGHETAFVDSDGVLNIVAMKYNGQVISARMNSRKSWTYGYIEASIWLPKGKGTWPAFWMMPSNYNWSSNPWPGCGEIDIMEEVGADPNRCSSTVHCNKYNNSGTSIEHAERYISTAESAFHTYALEWTADYMTFYQDGKSILTYRNDGSGKDAWPFYSNFYVILNLAWGGSWGGYKGVDETALPCTMKIDYVRVFQKK